MNFENQEPKSEDLQRLEQFLEKSEKEDVAEKADFERERTMDKEVANEVLFALGARGSNEVAEMYRELVRAGNFSPSPEEDDMFLKEFRELQKAGV